MFDKMMDYEILETLENGMEAFVWREDDGWYGEVADPGEYCQGAAHGVKTRQEAVDAVMQEVGHIKNYIKNGY